MRTTLMMLVFLGLVTPVLAEEQVSNTMRPGPLTVYSAADPARPGDEPTLDWQVPTPREPSRLRADRRPAALPPLYVSLAALNVLDVYSTNRALARGAREANPVMATTNGRGWAALAIKAATTACTVGVIEKLRKKHRVAAVVTMVAVNGATAAIAVRNFRTAR